jgi:hypothetical protein
MIITILKLSGYHTFRWGLGRFCILIILMCSKYNFSNNGSISFFNYKLSHMVRLLKNRCWQSMGQIQISEMLYCLLNVWQWTEFRKVLFLSNFMFGETYQANKTILYTMHSIKLCDNEESFRVFTLPNLWNISTTKKKRATTWYTFVSNLAK